MLPYPLCLCLLCSFKFLLCINIFNEFYVFFLFQISMTSPYLWNKFAKHLNKLTESADDKLSYHVNIFSFTIFFNIICFIQTFYMNGYYYVYKYNIDIFYTTYCSQFEIIGMCFCFLFPHKVNAKFCENLFSRFDSDNISRLKRDKILKLLFV